MSKPLARFISEHRDELLARIKIKCPEHVVEGTEEIEEWVLNDEPLYLWAQREGVNI